MTEKEFLELGVRDKDIFMAEKVMGYVVEDGLVVEPLRMPVPSFSTDIRSTFALFDILPKTTFIDIKKYHYIDSLIREQSGWECVLDLVWAKKVFLG